MNFTPTSITKTVNLKKKLVRGFTLVEVLVALFILAGGMVFLFNSFLLGWQALAYSRKLNEVSLLAQKKLEELKSQSVIEVGKSGDKEGDLSWKVSTQALKLPADIEVIYVEIDIEFYFQGKTQSQRFVSYLSNEKTDSEPAL